jgi:hypothetical protein
MPDLTSVFVVAIVLAILVRVFWREILNVLIIGCLALMFAGILRIASVLSTVHTS